MNVKKKVTNFIRLEEGNIGKQAAIVTGALLASSVLGTVLTRPALTAPACCEYTDHTHTHTNTHSDHINDMPPGCVWCP